MDTQLIGDRMGFIPYSAQSQAYTSGKVNMKGAKARKSLSVTYTREEDDLLSLEGGETWLSFSNCNLWTMFMKTSLLKIPFLGFSPILFN